MIKLKDGEIIPLTDDLMFTSIFNDKDNICVLEEFIAAYFNFELEKVKGNLKIKSRELTKTKLIESNKTVDLLLDYNNRKYNIEMSTRWDQGIKDRNTVYISNIHGTQLKRGFNDYREIESSIQINLNAFDTGEKIKTSYYLRDEEGNIFSKKIRIDVINMERGRKICYTNNEEINEIIRWSKVFMSKTKEELEENLNEVVSTRTKEKLSTNISRLSGDDKMVSQYIGKSKREFDMEYLFERRMEGLDEIEKRLDKRSNELEEKSNELEEKSNELEEKSNNLKEKLNEADKKEIQFNKNIIEIANLLLDKNIDKKIISKLTGLSISQINKL